MRIAFHAPMKAPDDPIPSGDRTVARGLLAALRLAGHEIDFVPRFRSYEGLGDTTRQMRLERTGLRLARRCAARRAAVPGRGPELWFTYHLYHKAPDWLGPTVSRRLGIPYVVAEPSVALKQRGGRWARGLDASIDALGQADLAFGLNPNDLAGVRPHLRAGVPYLPLPPFLDPEPFRGLDRTPERARLGAVLGLPDDVPWIAVCAMMREDQKRLSYLLLAEALGRSDLPPFRLVVAGDGPARREIEAAFAPLGERVRFLGALEPAALRALLAASDLFAWPAVKEAFGMALLEAAFAGLPVVAGESPGVASIVAHEQGGLLVPEGDHRAFGLAVARLLSDSSLRTRMGRTARAKAFAEHTTEAAARRLNAGFELLRGDPTSIRARTS